MAYLDHAATTPMLPEAVAAVREAMGGTGSYGVLGNASSLHASGRAARRVVEESRERIAAALGAKPSDVVFTSGGTEANNLALKGLYWARRRADPQRRRILASAVEHHAVLDPVTWLVEHEGAEVEWLPVDSYGRLIASALEEAIGRDPASVACVTVMWANNEVGTVQPIDGVVAAAAAHGIPVHSDSVQAVGAVDVSFSAAGLDAMTVSAHKVGGPIGVGALLLGRGVDVVPLLHGGGQERDVRSGTLATAAIAGFGAAIESAVANREVSAKRIAGLRDDLIAGVLAEVPDAVLNGDPGPDPDRRLAGNAHFAFPGCEGDALLLLLDAQGIECSTGSACTAGVARPSHVLTAMGAPDDLARSTLRFSLGHTSTEADVRALVDAIGPAVERARNAAAVAALVPPPTPATDEASS
jgi:cysteine desulfurase